jgi:hypothetical protein
VSSTAIELANSEANEEETATNDRKTMTTLRVVRGPEPLERSGMHDDDLDFRQAITLRDGRPAVIRVMRMDDKPRLQSAFAKLDPQSVYTRFFSFRKSIPERAFERIGEIDFVQLAGLVVTLGSGADETICYDPR